jgi:hypothetical protein
VLQSFFMLTAVQPSSFALASDASAPLVYANSRSSMVDEHRELRGLEHLDVHVRVPTAERRQPAGRGK